MKKTEHNVAQVYCIFCVLIVCCEPGSHPIHARMNFCPLRKIAYFEYFPVSRLSRFRLHRHLSYTSFQTCQFIIFSIGVARRCSGCRCTPRARYNFLGFIYGEVSCKCTPSRAGVHPLGARTNIFIGREGAVFN